MARATIGIVAARIQRHDAGARHVRAVAATPPAPVLAPLRRRCLVCSVGRCGTRFVDGTEAALDRARPLPDTGRHHHGAGHASPSSSSGLIDELSIQVVPAHPGPLPGRSRTWDAAIQFEVAGVIENAAAIHIRFRVHRRAREVATERAMVVRSENR